jgi:hypothetical protein
VRSLNSGISKASLAPMPSTPPPARKYVSVAFGSLDQPWKPGHLRSAYGAMSCKMFKPKKMTDDIFLALLSQLAAKMRYFSG